MTSATNKTSTKRRLLLASDRNDQSTELAGILQSVGQVDTIATSDIPDAACPRSLRHRGRHQSALRRERATGAQQVAGRGLSRDAAAVRAGGCAPSWIDAGLGARRDRYDRAAVRRAGHPAADPRRVSGQRRIRRDRSRQGPEQGRRGRARRHGQDLRAASGRRSPEIQPISSRPRTRFSRRSSIRRCGNG